MKLINRRINIITFSLFLFITLFVYLVLLNPIMEHQKNKMIENFELSSLNQYQVIEEFINKTISDADSLSSRSVIRDALSKYNNNEIDWETLYNITSDKYKDGVNVLDDCLYSGRLVNNKILVDIGDPSVFNNINLPDTEERIVKYNSTNNTVIIKNPIFQNDQLLAYDILSFNAMPLLDKIQTNDHRIWIEPEMIQNKVKQVDGVLIFSKSFTRLNATFNREISEDMFFSSIHKTKKNIFLAFSMVLIGTFALFYLIVINYAKNIIKQFEVSRNAARDRETENKLLIQEMNKGFVLFKVVDDKINNELNYTILNVNKTFEETTNMDKSLIIGSKLCEVFPTIQKYWIDQLDYVVRTKKSVSFQIYVDYMEKWFLVSVYIPRESHLVMITDDITESISIQDKLTEKEKQMRITFDIIGEGIWDWNLLTNEIEHNNRLAEILDFDRDRDSHTYNDYLSYIYPKDRNAVQKRLRDAIDKNEEYYSEHRIVHRNGDILWVIDRGVLISDETTNNPIQMVGSILDITPIKKATEALSTEKETLKATLLSVGDAVVATDSFMKVNFINNEAEKLIGCLNQDVQGKNLGEVLVIFDEETGKLITNPIKEYIMDKKNHITRRILLKSKYGEFIPIQGTFSPIRFADKNESSGFVIAFRDITEQRDIQREIEDLSFKDHLTGLYNRRYLEGSLNRLDTKRRLPLTIMMLDINGLKEVNDNFGHQAGDDLIKAAAETIVESCRVDDLVARVGGDEFMILLPNTKSEDAEKIKERIIGLAKEKYICSNQLSIAIGYCVKKDDSQDINLIQKCADRKMYEDKLKRKKNIIH